MTKEEFMEVCKLLDQMGYSVYAISDPRTDDIPDAFRMGPVKKRVRRTLVNWDRELKILIKQGK